jgi:hypothetical protein
MPSTKLLLGGAAATAAIGIRVARSLHSRWRVLPEADRRRIERLAEDLKAKALDARGSPNRHRAGEDLRIASESFAAALVETAEADPQIGSEEVRELREELRRELQRLQSADIKASRTRREQASPPG